MASARGGGGGAVRVRTTRCRRYACKPQRGGGEAGGASGEREIMERSGRRNGWNWRTRKRGRGRRRREGWACAAAATQEGGGGEGDAGGTARVTKSFEWDEQTSIEELEREYVRARTANHLEDEEYDALEAKLTAMGSTKTKKYARCSLSRSRGAYTDAIYDDAQVNSLALVWLVLLAMGVATAVLPTLMMAMDLAGPNGGGEGDSSSVSLGTAKMMFVASVASITVGSLVVSSAGTSPHTQYVFVYPAHKLRARSVAVAIRILTMNIHRDMRG